MGYKIAIDGPAGAGKGFVASTVAKKLDYLYIDTGAMYRAFALYVSKNKIDINDEKKIQDALKNIDIKLVYDENKNLKVYLNEEDVSQDIRTEQIGMLSSVVSALPIVRKHMTESQRKLAGKNNVVMEGRDIGSVVFPDAEVKIFLTASREERAKRRLQDLLEKGRKTTYGEVLDSIRKRDELDTTKKISPLIKTDDMKEIDSTFLTKDEVIDSVIKYVKEKGLI